MFDLILSSSRKELEGQSANPTKAIRKLNKSGPTIHTGLDDNESSKIEPSDQVGSLLTPHSPIGSGHDLETSTGNEFGAVSNIVSDQASAYTEVWIVDTRFLLQLSYNFGNSWTELRAVHRSITNLTGFSPAIEHSEPRIQEIEDSLSEDGSDHATRGSSSHCPGSFVPVLESDADSVLTNDGSYFSNDARSHLDTDIETNLICSLRRYVKSLTSEIDHTEHPAFRTNFEGDSSNIQNTSPQITRELPALATSEKEDDGSRAIRTSTPRSAIQDSPTLGGNRNRITWYSGSLSCSEERFFSDEAPTVAPLRSPPLTIEHEGYLGNGTSKSSTPRSHYCTDLDQQPLLSSKHDRDSSPSQPTVQDGSADFWYTNAMGMEYRKKLHDDLDKWFAAGLDDEDGSEPNDMMDDGADNHEFSDAFLCSPLCPSNDRASPRISTNVEPSPDTIAAVSAAKATQQFVGATDDNRSATNSEVATATCRDKPPPCAHSFDTLRAFPRKEGQQFNEPFRTATPDFAAARDDDRIATYDEIATSAPWGESPLYARPCDTLRACPRKGVHKTVEPLRVNTADIPPVLRSPHVDQPNTRPPTPTDREINHYLQRTARPNTQTTLGVRRGTDQSYELGYGVKTTPYQDLKVSPEYNGTFPSAFDSQPQTAPLHKTLAQKPSLSVVTFQEPLPSKSSSTPTTPKTTPTRKKARFTTPWGRKGSLPGEVLSSPCTVIGPKPSESFPLGPSSFRRPPLTQTTYTSPGSLRSPLQMRDMTHIHHMPPPLRSAPATPMSENPPIPPRNPRRLARHQPSTTFVADPESSEMACNLAFPELQRDSMLFFKRLDPNAKTFYAEQKVSHPP